MEYWKKNLYALWAAQLLTMIGMNMVIPFLPFYVRFLGVSGTEDVAMWSGLAFAGAFMSSLFATPVWGSMSDRFGKKAMVVRAIFGLGIAQILVGLSQNVYQLFLFRLIQGAISGFIPAALTLVSSSSPKDKIGYSLGFLQSATAGGTVLGPFVGGLLADFVGYREIFFIVSALCFISAVVIIIYVKDLTQVSQNGKVHSVLSNYKFVFTHSQLRLIAVTIVIGQASALMIESIFALFVEHVEFNTQYVASLTGIVIAISGLFMFIATPWWGKRNDSLGCKKTITIALAGTGIFYAFHLFAYNIVVLMILRAGIGFVRGGILHTLFSLTNLHTPSERHGGLMGIASSMAVLGNMLGPLIGGFIAAKLGITSVFIFNSTMLLLTSVVIYRYLSDVRFQSPVEVQEAETA